jgi:CBS domain containing-hemolysin-like protein
MIILLTIAAFLMSFLVILVTWVQVMYLESLRIRSREVQSLQYFKEHIEPEIGLETERGALTFTAVKHTALGIVGCLILAITIQSAALWEALLGACLLTILMAVICAELIPQVLYRKSRGIRLHSLVPVLKMIALVVRPLIWSIEFMYSLFDLDGEGSNEAIPGAEAPIEALINAGEEEGIIEKGDRELIQSVVAFGDKTVREVLTPRPRIVAIDQNAGLEELRTLAIQEQYSRIPAYEGGIDNITGFVHVRDMFEFNEDERPSHHVRDILRPIRVVPETKQVNELLREMQEEGAHMAVVVDEYGSTAGIVTMEDLLEEIVGEIHDEHEPARDYTEEPGGSFVLSGSFDLDRLRDLLNYSHDEHTESTTVGGLITEWLGHVPIAGEKVERNGIMIEVLAANNLRVDQVRVAKAAAE